MERVIGGEMAGRQVEVKGAIEPRQILQAELSGSDCECHRSEVVREWVEDRWEMDSKGHRRRKSHKGRDTMSGNERLEPFMVLDQIGQVLVDPQGENIDWVQSVERFDPGNRRVEPCRSAASNLGRARRTLGYRYREWILPPQQRIYVLGGANVRSGESCIMKPNERGQKFMVSVKSEEEIAKGATSTILWLTIALGLCAIGGIVLIVLELSKG